METNNFDPILNPKAKKNQEESMEVSSTGYGLESVQKGTEEVSKQQKDKSTNPSCGGL